ncbi:uncharacterized protein LOC143429879 [Xylocopa sonorina]|uniref:uncharacterized protein LOC143429879 n=1 Tax=Xylocopa sonorina TaxID=1818115 RepID=UPI00403ABFD5
MDESFLEKIDSLRKQSRLLLTQVNENSRRVKEIKKLYCQNWTHGENCGNNAGATGSLYKGNIKSWKLRNDSSGVGGALRSDCLCNSPNQTLASMPNTSTVRRVLTSSKKRSEHQHCLENVRRKSVKGCYCNPETKKVQLRSTRTRQKQYSPCKRCKSHANFPAIVIEDNYEKPDLTSPISCETLRRVQRIDYAPRSQFLRNVRSRVSILQSTAGRGDCPETCYKSPCYHEFMANKNISKPRSIYQLKTDGDKPEKLEIVHARVRSETSDEQLNSGIEVVEKSNKGVQVSLGRPSKYKDVIKKTLSSKTSVPDVKSNSSLNVASKKTVSNKGCQCCQRSMSEYSKPTLNEMNHVDTKEYQDSVCTNRSHKENKEYLSDKEVRELKKFREQNYFDTHGSNHTLVSSKSSGSLEQYLLNDRLFPEPVRRVHKKDLVVTMPACATVQRKRVHYFPRYIVRQEKGNFNGNCKKKRCQSCPLTGHAIDLGITKIRAPLNSLALKYQKRLP